MAYIYDLTDTWNAGGTTFNAIKMNVTDSASASASKLVTLQTNGTEHFSVTKGGQGYFSGNVGVGTSSPGARLEVTRTDAANGIRVTVGQGSYSGNVALFGVEGQSNGYYITKDAVNNIQHIWDGTGGAERMRIDSSGNLLVNRSSTSGLGKLNVQGGADFTGGNVYLARDTGLVIIGAGSNIGSEKVLLKQSGGAGNPVARIWNNETSGNNEFFEFATEASYTTRGSITYNRGAGQVSYNVTSDYRAKDILGPVEDSGATIDALKIHTGKMHDATIERPMLVAHEAQEVVPYAVTGKKDAVKEDGTPDYQQVDHQVLIPLLIAELQSLRARVAQLEGN